MANKLMWGIFLVAVAVLGIISAAEFGYIGPGKNLGAQTQTCADGSIIQIGQTCPTPVSTSCTLAPAITYAVVNALSTGTSITPSGQWQITNGNLLSGYTTPTAAGTYNVLLNASGYLNQLTSNIVLKCGGTSSNLVQSGMYAYVVPTEQIVSSNWGNPLTNSSSGGAVNETTGSSGAQYNWVLKETGTQLKSTGNQLFILEFQAPVQNISTVTVDGQTPISTPNGYTRQGTTSATSVYAFLLPLISGSTSSNHNIQVQANTNYIITGMVNTTTYSLQPFYDTNGRIQADSNGNGIAGWNSVNTAEYATSTGYNFLIK